MGNRGRRGPSIIGMKSKQKGIQKQNQERNQVKTQKINLFRHY